ncbi:MAG: CHAT domain-containing protein [Saprospiraceae bacterium]
MNRVCTMLTVHKNGFLYLWLVFFSSCLVAQSQDSIKAMALFELAKEEQYSNVDSSFYHFEAAAELFKRAQLTEYYLKARNNASQLSYHSGDVDKAHEIALQLEKEGKAFLGDTSRLYAAFLQSLSNTYFGKGDLPMAIKLTKQSIDILESKTDLSLDFTLYLSYNHQGLAMYYDYNNDGDLAIEHINKGLLQIKDQLGEDNLYTQLETAIAYTNIASFYLKKEENKKAESYLMRSLRLFDGVLKGKEEELVDLNSRRGVLYIRLSEFYLDSKPDSAMYWAQQALKVKQGELLQQPLAFNQLGRTYDALGMIPEARNAFKKGIGLLDSIFDYAKAYVYHPTQLLYLAELEFKAKNYDTSLALFHEIINYVSTGANIASPQDNPRIEDILSYGYDFVYQAVEKKAKIFYQKGLQNKDKKQFLFALDNYDHVIALAREIRHMRWSEGAKQYGAKRDLFLYEGAIQTALALYQQTNESKFLDRAFYFAEQSKDALLLESINETTAKNYGEIPDSLLAKENALRLEKAYLVKAIAEEKNKKTDAKLDRIKQWEDKLFTVRKAYFELIDLFEKQYPRYYDLKYQTHIASVADVQKSILDDQTIVLEYFVGEAHVYLFRIGKAETKYYVFEKPASFEEDINAFLAFFRKPDAHSSSLSSFGQKANEWYNWCLAPALVDAPSGINRIMIIPDDLLSYLPMEALLTQWPADATKAYPLAEWPYLFKDYVINYNYSASILLRSLRQRGKRNKRSFLGMAPSFQSPIAAANRTCSADELYSLQCSQGEVTEIGALFASDTYLGLAANRADFLKEATHYRMIHLATHSCIDAENPMLDKIFFTDDYLTNYELYGLNLNAELAVLSACNTGSGKLLKGEGVMSLSKGFIHAGVPSTVTSLWSVDDCATSSIMIHFYKYLKKGWAKDMALRQAKLDFLSSADKIYQHPYFWAAFVQVGDYKPISKNSFFSLPILLAGLSLILLLAGWNRRRRKILT